MFDDKPRLGEWSLLGVLLVGVVLLILAALPAHAQAITTCPDPVPKYQICVRWVAPTTRSTPVGAPVIPLALSEIGSYQLFLGPVLINNAVAADSLAYLYDVPRDKCVNVGDVWNMTTTDTNGLVGPQSLKPWTMKVQVCGPKSLPSPPTFVATGQGG